MAKFTITKATTVADLNEQFRDEVGGALRVYQGRCKADDDDTLVQLGAKTGELEYSPDFKAGRLIKAFSNELNLKVGVYTKNFGTKVLDGITLANVIKLPVKITKAKMEEYLSGEDGKGKSKPAKVHNMKIPKYLKGRVIVDITMSHIDWPVKWPDDDEEIEEERYKKEPWLYSAFGVAIAFAIADYDSDEMVPYVCVGDLDECIWEVEEFAEENSKEENPEMEVSVSTDIRIYGIDKQGLNWDDEIGHAIAQYVEYDDGIYRYRWNKDVPALFRLKWEHSNDVFIVSKDGDLEEELLDSDIDKMIDSLIELEMAKKK